MMRFQVPPFDAAECTVEAVACLELISFFRGEGHPSDLPIDRDSALDHFIDSIDDAAIRGDYRAEPQFAEDQMLDELSAGLNEKLMERKSVLGEHYPFVLGEGGVLHRRPAEALSSISLAYLALQFFRALKADAIEILDQDGRDLNEIRRMIDRTLQRVFEYIAAYTVAGRSTGVPYVTSECRSSERLARILERMCRRVGAGRVRPYGDWTAGQKASNDGGVDCIVHTGGPGMPGDAYLILVGATVQSRAIDAKIMGRDEREKFGAYFSIRPSAFQSALVRPQDEDALTREKCNDRDCLLFAYEAIWRNIGKRNHPNAGRRLREIDSSARKLFRGFYRTRLLFDFKEFGLI